MKLNTLRGMPTGLTRLNAAAVVGVIFLLWFLAAVGWILNLYQIITTAGPLAAASTWTILLVMKIIGVLAAPLGVVLGWFGLFF